MLFESAPQKACYEKIRPWMQELFGDKVEIRDDLPIFIIPRGSAYAAVEVLPKNVGLKPRPLGRLYAILKTEARVVNLSKNPVAT